MLFIYNLLLTIPHLLLANKIITLEYLELGSGYYLRSLINITPSFDNYILINLKDSRTVAVVTSYRKQDPHYEPDNITIVVNKETYDSFYEVDLFSIRNSPIQMYLPIYYIKHQSTTNKKYIQSFIGFGNDVNQQSIHSFLHTLHIKQYISYKSFAFDIMHYQKSSMYIGGIPDNIKYKYKYKTEIKVNTSNPHISKWFVNLKGIKISLNNNSKSNSNEVEVGWFETNEYLTSVHVSDKKIIVPREFMKKLNETVFDKYYKNGVCSYRINLNEYITCELDEMEESFCIEFFIDENVFKMCGGSLFEEVDRRSRYGMSYIQVNGEGNAFEIGTMLIDFYLTEFDMEKQIIRMFSRFKFNGKNYRNRNGIVEIGVYFVLFGICVVWSGFLVYVKVKINKM